MNETRDYRNINDKNVYIFVVESGFVILAIHGANDYISTCI